MNDHSSGQSVWTAGTILLLVLCLVGTGGYIYCSNRHKQELTTSENLRNEVITLQATQKKLEKAVARLELLPPIAEADWEKVLTDQINGAAIDAGVQVASIKYATQVDEKEPSMGTITVNIEVKGSYWAQEACLAFLEQRVVGMRFETVEGLLGGGELSYLNDVGNTRGNTEAMKITGKVYRSMGGSS